MGCSASVIKRWGVGNVNYWQIFGFEKLQCGNAPSPSKAKQSGMTTPINPTEVIVCSK